jgi:transcriptional regulator with XRE-family HTH domain
LAKILSADRKSSIGSEARKLRISLHLTQQELAHVAGVSPKDISLLEQDLHLPSNCKLNILRELWVRTFNPKSI